MGGTRRFSKRINGRSIAVTGSVTLRRMCCRRISDFLNRFSRLSPKKRCTSCRAKCRRQNRSLSALPTYKLWQLYLSGRARVTIFGAHGRTRTETFGPGEVAFIKQGFGHCVEQIGDEPTKVLILLKSPVYEEINISTWLAANPASFITDNFSVGKELLDKLPTQSVGIAAAQAG